MNTVPTGADIYGFGAAAQQYFGVPVEQADRGPGRDDRGHAAGAQLLQPDPKAGAAYQALVYRWHYVLTPWSRWAR